MASLNASSSRFAWIVVLACGIVFASTPIAWAGTTGSLSGTLMVTGTTEAISGATVTAASPSETVTTHTDRAGYFIFVSLAPDTYTVTATAAGYDPASVSGVTVQSDNTQTVTLTTQRAVKTIGKIVTRAAALVKPGTTANVYSVTAASQEAAAGLGGGGYLNNAASAISSVPGAFVPQGQNGIYPSIFIRGGNYTHVGYEYDGVPLQRAFDQYPGADLSTLGQQELQVYTGAAPVNSDSTALAGFVNQVIKTGTYPGYSSFKASFGSPTMYNNFALESAGANPSRLFSYFVGFGGFDEGIILEKDHEFDALYGGVLNIYSKGSTCAAVNVMAGCYRNTALGGTRLGPTGYQYGLIFWGSRNWFAERDNVVNLHFGIPHHRDSGRDDIQVLYSLNWQRTVFQTQLADWGPFATDVHNGTVTLPSGTLPQCGGSPAWPAPRPTNCNVFGAQEATWLDGSLYTGPMSVPLGAFGTQQVVPYFYPGSPTNRAFNSAIVPSQTDGDSYNNNSAIFKLQYQHNIGSNAFLRIYGYTNYSDWLQFAPQGIAPSLYGSISPDYKLGSHTRGLTLNFTDQITDKHLLNFNASYTTSHTFRDNASTWSSSRGGTVAYLVDSTNPTNGQCYRKSGVLIVPANCLATGAVTGAARFLLPPAGGTQLMKSKASDPDINVVATFTCGGGPCEYFIVGNGVSSILNTVTPVFMAGSIQDTWKPNDRFTFTFGLRYDDFRYNLTDTVDGPARQFWVNYYNTHTCFNPTTSQLGPSTTGTDTVSTGPVNCPVTYAATFPEQLAFSAKGLASLDYPEFQPRFGMTYTANANDVLRFSYGKYAQPAASAFQQYDTQQPNLVAGTNLFFYTNGFRNPTHMIFPEESFSTDFSWEHQASNDLSWSLTPYYRTTRNELATVQLDTRTNFVTALNVGQKRVKGIEFIVRKGDLSRNGLYGQLSYTYTDAKIRFTKLPNGHNVADGLNLGIKRYNAYTSFCASNPSDARCGVTTSGAVGVPCYTAFGAPDAACLATSVANPYWNAPVQPLFDPNGWYDVYSRFSGDRPLSGSSGSYLVPHVVTLVLNYKHDRWNFTPTVQLQAGSTYGRPLELPGIDPVAGCGTPLVGTTTGDPRYPFGGPAVGTGGRPYDARNCLGSGIGIPDPYTGKFDNFGAFKQPTKVGANFAVSYQWSPRIKLSALAANVYTGCYGGSNVPWKVTGYSKAGCVYGGNTSTSNFYNPGDVIDPQILYPYGPVFGSVFQSVTGAQNNPFQAYFTMEIKI